MHRIILNTFVIILLLIGVFFAPYIQATCYNDDNLLVKEIEFFLRFYGLNKKSTIGDFEQLLYMLVTKQEIKFTKLSAELKNDIVILSSIFLSNWN